MRLSLLRSRPEDSARFSNILPRFEKEWPAGYWFCLEVKAFVTTPWSPTHVGSRYFGNPSNTEYARWSGRTPDESGRGGAPELSPPDLVAMNTTFTRSGYGNLTFGNVPEVACP